MKILTTARYPDVLKGRRNNEIKAIPILVFGIPKLFVDSVLDRMSIPVKWIAAIFAEGNHFEIGSLIEAIQALLGHWLKIHASPSCFFKEIKSAAIDPLFDQHDWIEIRFHTALEVEEQGLKLLTQLLTSGDAG